MTENIFPTTQAIGRGQKEKLLKQKGFAIWFVGLSGAGKTTIAIALEKELYKRGFLTQLLDADNIRAGINNNLGFSEADRHENIRRAAEIAKLFVNTGVITICCFISPTESIRNCAKNIIGEKDYYEIFVNTPLYICEQRDVKGLYKKARAGELKDFTGIHSLFEHPQNSFLEVKPEEENMDQIVCKIMAHITLFVSG